jgi:hypothetical protein
MINTIPENLKEQLLNQPETGMGYQFVQLIDWSNLNKNKIGVVYNAKYFIESDSYFRYNQKQLFFEQHKILESNFTPISENFESVKVMIPSEFKNDSDKLLLSELLPDYNKSKGARESNTIYFADGKSYYIRLSAFDDDKRIDKINKRLLPGSYATTYEDYLKLKDLKLRPNDRYALPNDQTITQCFVIQPKMIDTYKKGIVQPANGYKGGGVEVFFEKGTSNGTFIKQMNYGRY